MKFTILKATFFALAIILISAACGKGDDPTSDLSLGELIATIDGEAFNSIGAAGVIYDTFNINSLTITGIKNVGLTGSKTIAVAFSLPENQDLTTKTYSYNFDADGECDEDNLICGGIQYTVVDAFNPSASIFTYTAIEAGSSTITISSLDYQKGGSAKGTFSGTLVETDGTVHSLTDGAFYVQIQ